MLADASGVYFSYVRTLGYTLFWFRVVDRLLNILCVYVIGARICSNYEEKGIESSDFSFHFIPEYIEDLYSINTKLQQHANAQEHELKERRYYPGSRDITNLWTSITAGSKNATTVNEDEKGFRMKGRSTVLLLERCCSREIVSIDESYLAFDVGLHELIYDKDIKELKFGTAKRSIVITTSGETETTAEAYIDIEPKFSRSKTRRCIHKS